MTVAADYSRDLLSVFVYKLIKVLNKQIPTYPVAARNGHLYLKIRNSGKVTELVQNKIYAVRKSVSALLRKGDKLLVLL